MKFVDRLKTHSAGKYIRNTGWLLFEKIFRMGMVFLVTAYIARYLGPKSFGVLSYAQSFVGLFSAFASLGVDQIVTREIIAKKYAVEKLLGCCFVLKIIGAAGVTIIALLITYLSGQSFEVAIIISLVSLATVFQASSTVTIYFQSLVKSKIISISQVTSLVISSAFKVYLVFEQADLIWFGFALLLDSVVTALLLLISYLMRAGNPFLWVFDKSLAKTVLGESWPLIISSAVIAVYTRIDQVMLKSMLDESAVGIYSVAVRISESTVIVPGVVVASFFPAVVAAKKKTKEEYDKAVLLFFSLIVYSE